MSRVRGVTKLRKTLNRLEPSITRRVKDAVLKSAREIEKDAVGLAIAQDIKITGDLIHSITYKLSSDKLSAHIGPGADRQYVQKNPFSNTLLEKGIYSSAIKAGGRLSSAGAAKFYTSAKYIRDVEARWNFMKGFWAEFGTGPPIPQEPQPFMEPAYEFNKVKIGRWIGDAVDRALAEAVR